MPQWTVLSDGNLVKVTWLTTESYVQDVLRKVPVNLDWRTD